MFSPSEVIQRRPPRIFFAKSEMEDDAKIILRFLAQNGDTWRPFKPTELVPNCEPTLRFARLERAGYLYRDGDELRVLAEFVDQYLSLPGSPLMLDFLQETQEQYVERRANRG